MPTGPMHDISSMNSRMRTLQWLIGRAPGHTQQLAPFETDHSISQSFIDGSNI
jgi:hypothetical protein